MILLHVATQNVRNRRKNAHFIRGNFDYQRFCVPFYRMVQHILEKLSIWNQTFEIAEVEEHFYNIFGSFTDFSSQNNLQKQPFLKVLSLSYCKFNLFKTSYLCSAAVTPTTLVVSRNMINLRKKTLWNLVAHFVLVRPWENVISNKVWSQERDYIYHSDGFILLCILYCIFSVEIVLIDVIWNRFKLAAEHLMTGPAIWN